MRLMFLTSLCFFSVSWALEDTEILYKRVKKKIVEDDLKERKLRSFLYIINEQMKKMSSEISEVTDRAFSTQSRAKDLAQRIARFEEKVQLGQRELSKRLRLMYKLNSQLLVRILFSSTNAHELSKNLLFLKKLSHRDSEFLESLKFNIESLQTSKDQLRGKVKKLIALKNALKTQERELENKQKYKMSLISKVKRKRTINVSKMKDLRVLLNKEKTKSDLLTSSFFERKGKLIHPVKGRLSDSYGVIRDSRYKYLLTHKGHFYQASKGSLVYGVHPGKVAYSGIINGYGRTIIVDHDDHYYTVYAGHDSVNILEGQEVEEGTILGSVGFSKRHQKTGTYFEIRHFSDAVNPAQWLTRDTQKTL